jgi:hypothetical protein
VRCRHGVGIFLLATDHQLTLQQFAAGVIPQEGDSVELAAVWLGSGAG